MIETFALLFKANTGTFAEGLTVKEDPIHNRKSHDAACWKALVRSIGGSFSPK